ncbi:hypothetical protein ACWGQ5_31710 [Streptomyces sp. NPDC055722]
MATLKRVTGAVQGGEQQQETGRGGQGPDTGDEQGLETFAQRQDGRHDLLGPALVRAQRVGELEQRQRVSLHGVQQAPPYRVREVGEAQVDEAGGGVRVQGGQLVRRKAAAVEEAVHACA